MNAHGNDELVVAGIYAVLKLLCMQVYFQF
jgi:hypothetical protein